MRIRPEGLEGSNLGFQPIICKMLFPSARCTFFCSLEALSWINLKFSISFVQTGVYQDRALGQKGRKSTCQLSILTACPVSLELGVTEPDGHQSKKLPQILNFSMIGPQLTKNMMLNTLKTQD